MSTSTIKNPRGINELVEFQLDTVTNTSGSYSHATTINGITPDHKVITIECSDKSIFQAPINITTGTNSITLQCNRVSGTSTVKVYTIMLGDSVPTTSLEYGALSTRVGNLSDLTTSDNSSVVNAINSLPQYTIINNPVSASSHTVSIPNGTKELIARLNYRGNTPQAISPSVSLSYLRDIGSSATTRLTASINNDEIGMIAITNIQNNILTCNSEGTGSNTLTLIAVS